MERALSPEPTSLPASVAAPAAASSTAPAPMRRVRAPRVLRSAGVLALGSALPERAVASADIGARLGVSGEWIERRTGIRSRRFAAPGERVCELAARAGAAALDAAGVDPAALDLILLATVASDDITPASAPLVAHELGASHVAAIDVGAACAGSLAALAHACSWIECGRAERVLVIGAEVLSRFIDFDDPRTAPLFADGAGAMLVGCESGGSLGPVVLGSDGAAAGAIRVTRERGLLEMEGHDTFLMATERLSAATREAAALAGVELHDIDLFVYHQANSRILASVAARLELERGRVFDCIAELGNTSAASIPLALERAALAGLLAPGARVLLGAVGAGLVWGATVLTWGDCALAAGDGSQEGAP